MKSLSKTDNDKAFTKMLIWDAVKLAAIIGVSWFIILLIGIEILHG